MVIKDLNFICTCEVCPEQYDVKDFDGNQVGYVRLRWGHISCACPDCGGETVYGVDIGCCWDGCFANKEQREYHLSAIADAIHGYLARRYSSENWE